ALSASTVPPGDAPHPPVIRVGIVPHTHWDREWHVPFQAGRVRLVRFLDGLLDELDAGRLSHFWLDGQTALVDDYLAVRPEAEDRVRAAVMAGRLGIGPWAVPMDEFVVSPETIVRNLQAGRRRAVALGATGPWIGYGPDIFGHVAQLPQLLRLSGIGHAVVWRGVPEAVAGSATAFRWEAPDGSAVRAEYLYGSYANGRGLPADGAGLVQRAGSWEAEVGHRRVGGLLLMNGGDQRWPETWVTGAVAEANAGQDRYRFEVADLPRWLGDERDAVHDGGLPVWRGELRSAARAPLLSGVISNRVDVRAAAATAERVVERRAEPLLALFRPAAEWSAAAGLLAVAWDRLIANSAHDSACACCTDPVAAQVLARYAEARQIGEALADQALGDLVAEIGSPAGAVVVVNPTMATRSGVVAVTTDAGSDPAAPMTGPDGIVRAVQLLGLTRAEVFAAQVSGAKVGWVADRIIGSAFDGRPVRSWAVERAVATGGVTRLRFEAAGPDDVPVDVGDARRALLDLGREEVTVAVHMEGPLRRTVLVETGPVLGYGWTTLIPAAPPAASGASWPTEPAGIPVRVEAGQTGGAVLDNGIVRVEVDPEDGTFSIATRSGLRAAALNRFVDGGDGGDTYTWCPPEVDTVIDRARSVAVEIEESGPLRGRVAITATYDWPVSADGGERACGSRAAATTTATIRTAVSLVAGDPMVEVETALENRCRDHRLRVHFPLPVPVSGADAGCAFAVVHRGLDVEGGPPENPPPTFPARRFVDCSGPRPGPIGGVGTVGLAVVADGTFEYEVVGEGRELALTLLRATGWLSRRRLPLRPDPAGPAVPVEGAQVQGPLRWRYGLLLHAGNWEAAHLSRWAGAFLNPLEAVVGSADRPVAAPAFRAPDGRALRVEGAEVSSVVRDRGDLVVRLFHPGSQLVSATIAGPDGEAVTGVVEDLAGSTVGRFDGTVGLRPGEIVTVRLGRRPEAG
ncbi:MAG TPA: glycoside hydrolase family 38 C-terminal domain-containing protein, partial [Acidimicrobiia bacterium]|nr:glycoside hydrolase family 38 C-terminal domain-containing protein [Acidimicrobiia bacterium]